VNGPRHVVIALGLTLILFVIAGDQWSARIGAFRPVGIAPKAT
jgi:hypothetical protein